MGGNYFNTAQNIGYINGQEYRDHNAWRRDMQNQNLSQEETNFGTQEGYGGGGGFGGDFSKTLQSALDVTKKAAEPGVKALQESKPNIEARYNNFIAQLKGEKDKTLGDIRQQTSGEFSKRGIPLSSTSYEEAVTQRQQPAQTDYLNRTTGATLQSGAEINQVDQAIANLMSGGISGGNVLQSALGFAQLGQDQNQFQQTLAYNKANASQPNQSLLTLPSTGGYIIDPRTGSIINQLGGVRNQFGGGSWEFM